MDRPTIDAYDRDSKSFADDWETQSPPTDLHAVVRRFFKPGPSADIGCGSGRDAAWLNANGYPATGFDASEALLAEARRRHPEVEFRSAALPELPGIVDGSFDNVLCETVIMHLDDEAIAPAVERLLAILAPGGVLYLSWRTTDGAAMRDEHGRLYAAFDPETVLRALETAQTLLNEQTSNVSSGKTVRRIVARKHDIGDREPI
jgi:SAM-dependent methyltransferase